MNRFYAHVLRAPAHAEAGNQRLARSGAGWRGRSSDPAVRRPGSCRSASSNTRNDLANNDQNVQSISEIVKCQFQDWYCRFLAHFVRIYENSAPLFVHNELMWSADIQNTQKYLEDLKKGSHGMDDIIGLLNPQRAIKKLSKEEQAWARTNSKWPYS